ncbi:MerR family transcriptional regulator [Tabrizicola flagellatus]|uniref:MerR family transcriptional regulator n=1 Tax=Tabrizicola flagellatus TaxID=2593021 RepID=UPI0011F16EA9|nr:MerR family transcriptional regulator [Tabrizicola flagellatus]
MDKSPEAFRTISEVAEQLDTPAHVLRFWESRFPQIKPVKRAGGRRYYRPSDVALLTGIKRLLHDEGLTIRGVQKILRDHGVRQVAGLTDDSVTLDDLAVIPAPPAPAPVTAPVPESGFIHIDDSTEASAGTAEPPRSAAARPATSAQTGLPLFDAPPAFGTATAAPPAPAAPRKPTRRDDVTFASLIRALPPGALRPRTPEIAGIAQRLRALRDRLAVRAEGGND